MPISDTHVSIIEKLKRAAKAVRRAQTTVTQAQALDLVASLLGFNNWSLLHKHVGTLPLPSAIAFEDGLYKFPQLAALMLPQFPPFDEDAAVEEMTQWVRANFTPLVEFAFYDNESENGYAWPDEDLDSALQDEFDKKYPLELIQKVALDLEVDEGPWGIEDYGPDGDDGE